MEKSINLLFELIQNAIENEPLKDSEIVFLKDNATLNKILKIASFHDLSHLPSKALLDNNIIEKNNTELFNTANTNVMLSIYRYEQLDYITKGVYSLFEENDISYLPLKGEVIRDIYPEKWMRTSCDADIFVKRQDVDKAVKLISDNLGGKVSWSGNHDIPIFFDNDTHIELHFSFDDLSDLCPGAFDNIEGFTVNDKNKNRLIMEDKYFYLHHIAHMAKHIKLGGCGLRPFIDLYLMNKNGIKKDEDLLKKYNLLTFAESCENLSFSIFGKKPLDKKLYSFGHFIIRGGVYGIDINSVKSSETVLNKKRAKRIILPYDELKYIYKPLVNHKFLYPVYTVVRLFNLAFITAPKLFKRRKKAKQYQEKNKTDQMFDIIGL